MSESLKGTLLHHICHIRLSVPIGISHTTRNWNLDPSRFGKSVLLSDGSLYFSSVVQIDRRSSSLKHEEDDLWDLERGHGGDTPILS